MVKISVLIFFSKKWSKMVKNDQKWSKLFKNEHFWKKKQFRFFLQIDSECFKCILNRKNWFRKKKNIPVENFFFWDLNIFDETSQKIKIFVINFEKKTFLESIQKVSKRILNRKSWFRKKNPVDFFWDLTIFDRNSQKVKIFEKNFDKFFGGIDSEGFKTYFKPKKLVSKKISRWKFFSGT